MNRLALQTLAYDVLCVMAMVIIGTRNHDTDTGVSGVLFVGAPFLIATIVMRLVPVVFKQPRSILSGVIIWIGTVAFGMLLRNFVFDRGTALAFIIVASVFLGVTMNGWRIALTVRK